MKAHTSLLIMPLFFYSIVIIAENKLPFLDISKSESQVEFLALGKPSFIRIQGITEGNSPVQGQLLISEEGLKGSASLLLDKLDTGIGLRNRHMKDNYLEIEKFPLSTFTFDFLKVSPGFQKSAQVQVEDLSFSGTLKLRDQSKKITGKATIAKNNSLLQMTFITEILLSDYGIKIPSYLGITVQDKVALTISIKGKMENP